MSLLCLALLQLVVVEVDFLQPQLLLVAMFDLLVAQQVELVELVELVTDHL